ncbi:MAG: helical backbone metal receptor [Acidobacteriota bacterium]|nr:helical backbone metal receptor [Acidobacteriota bacterium]
MPPPRRVISLCPSITETIVALGGLKQLVAATRFCVRPEGLLWGLPRIGGTKNPDLARILDLKPDLVFANQEENRREDVEALRDAGVEVLLSFPRTVNEVPAEIRRWAERLGSSAEGEALAARLEAEIDALEEAPRPPPFLYAYWIWKDPWMTVSDDTYIADLIALAGGVNVYGREADRYPGTSPAESLSRGADVHFFPDEPFPFTPEKHGAECETLFGTERVRLFVSGDDFCWHGARTLEGLGRVRALRAGFGE